MAAVLLLAAAGAFGAEERPRPAVGLGMLPFAAPGAAPSPQPVDLDLAALADARRRAERQQETRLTLTLDPGNGRARRPVTMIFERSAATERGFALTGRIDGTPWGRCVLVVNDEVVAGTLWMPEGVFTIRTLDAGRYEVVPMSARRRPLAPPRPPPALPEGAVPPSPLPPPPAEDVRNPPAESWVDVLTLWSPAARTLAGGVARIEAKVDMFVATANDAYQAGGVKQRLNLVGAAEIDYHNESAAHIELLPDAANGFLDEIHELRDSYAADAVTLLVEFEVGGIAILMAELDQRFAQFAFNMVHVGDETALVFAHELGHTMGLQHDRYEVLRGLPAEPPPDVKLALFPFSFGYVNQRAFEPVGGPCWHTIMAYPDQCDDAGLLAVGLPRFSHPAQRYPPPDGDPLGVPLDAPEAGHSGPTHAVHSLNRARHTVAAFRDASTRCGYSVTAPDAVLPAAGGSLTVQVDADAGCAWRAHHQADFLAVSGSGTGTGPGAVVYEVQPNPGIARTGVLSIAAETIPVRQLGAMAQVSVCDRSPAVRDAIVASFRLADCGDIDAFDLAEVTALFIVGGEPALQPNDMQGLVNLTILNLVGATDLSPLAGLTNLRHLGLAGNGIVNIAPLANLEQLQYLSLNGNRVADLSPLEGLTRLADLDITGNRISSLAPLANLTSLLALQAGDNAIADLSPLANLPTLVVLMLADNAITDIAPLLGMRWLRYVDLRGNPLAETALEAHIPALLRRGVVVLFDEEALPPRSAWWWSLLRGAGMEPGGDGTAAGGAGG